ncbi:MAG: hypothetical protein EP338_11380 [Bacteroidetes bacterium]|nr:MAG: hypothetical protein EP338_11380 [Bacteroidota bacterium]
MRHLRFGFLLGLISILFAWTYQEKSLKRKDSLKDGHSAPLFLSRGEQWAEEKLKAMSLEEKIGQFFMLATWSNKGEDHQKEIESYVKEHGIGGLIYFQGDRASTRKSITRMQKASKIPLMIAIDAEWGLGMRLNGEERFPYAYTIGAANDPELSGRIGEMIGEECRELGIHLNFAPVADVNSNPENPVIGFRSFSENPDECGVHTRAMLKGMERQGILSSIKHFPGHGDTRHDSHYELPVIKQSKEQLQESELRPFAEGIQAGVSTVMMGHLSVPAIDSSGTPASLSDQVIQGVLRKQLNFKGLVVSDALNMKAVAGRYGKAEVVVKAFQAGTDILLFPENVKDAIRILTEKVNSGEISQAELDRRCKRLLQAKYHVLHPEKKVLEKKTTPTQREWARRQCYEKAMCMVKNNGVLPLVQQYKRVAIVRIGVHSESFSGMASRFHRIEQFHFFSFEEAVDRMKGRFDDYDVILTTVHPTSVLARKNFSIPGNLTSWLEAVPRQKDHILVHFGNPKGLHDLDLERLDALVIAYENHHYAQEAAVQSVFGASEINGKLNFKVSESIARGAGQKLEWGKRLKYSLPEEVGIASEKMNQIDSLVLEGINAGAYPGCQVLFALEGKIIYQKSFGSKTYKNKVPIRNDHVYDIASISKVVGSTAAMMRLQSLSKFSLQNRVKDYLPTLTSKSDVGNIQLRNMLAHQAGLRPWIPFFLETVKDGHPDPSIYSKVRCEGYDIQVAEDLWIRNDYEDYMFKRMLNSPLKRNPRYKYSDLGYYFTRRIVEKEAGCRQDEFLYEEFYGPMGLRNIRYLPHLYFPLERIVPTENDTMFREQVVHGYVHDPGAAMLGGIGGHAGIFSNSHDLAAMMQLFLNGGVYGNHRYIDQSVIKEYTSQQLKGNRRGAGFDRPTGKRRSPCCSMASDQSFGHSGFTGTFTWADPSYGLNYVFLSNRVYPDAANQKINQLSIRTRIQRKMYDILLESGKEHK